MSDFDPDAYLQGTTGAAPFDPDTYLSDTSQPKSIKDTPAKIPTPRVSSAEEYIGGPAQLAASSLLNIPYGAAHAGVDLYNRIAHGDTDASDPDWVSAIHVPTTPASKQLLADIRNPNDINTQIQNIRNQRLGPANATVADVANQTGQVVGDVGNLAAGYGLVKGVPGLLRDPSE